MVKLKIGAKAAGPVPAAAPAAELAPEPVPAPAPVATYEAAATYEPPTTYTPPPGNEQLAPTYEPPAFDPSATVGGVRPPGSGLAGMFDTGEVTAADRDRQAALDWERVIAPVMEMMRASVPDATTPEEAARILGENQGEITPDPKGGSYIHGDAFDRDARVYYRLLHRDYEAVPRPSQIGKRPTSHHLHQLYGKLTGNKGW